MYRDEKGVYIFDGDLEQFLLNRGVEEKHIERMKNKILKSNKEKYYSSRYFETGKSESEIRLVPLEKVIGTSRGTVGKSVFENVRVMSRGEREPHRFENCFSFLKEKTLEEVKKSYEVLFFPVSMDYYSDEDEYFLTCDGNHRTLTAMLLGAENIRANVTKMYCDFAKREKYCAIEKFYKDFNIVQINDMYFNVEIVFCDGDHYFCVRGFPKRKDENCYEYIRLLSNEIQADMKVVNIWKRLPEIIRVILEWFTKNRRINQYIKKSRSIYGDTRIDLCDFD